MQIKLVYAVLIMLWSFFQSSIGFTATIASFDLKKIIKRSWQGTHLLVSRKYLGLWYKLIIYPYKT